MAGNIRPVVNSGKMESTCCNTAFILHRSGIIILSILMNFQRKYTELFGMKIDKTDLIYLVINIIIQIHHIPCSM